MNYKVVYNFIVYRLGPQGAIGTLDLYNVARGGGTATQHVSVASSVFPIPMQLGNCVTSPGVVNRTGSPPFWDKHCRARP